MSESQTPAPVTDWQTDLDHFDPRFIQDPYPIYAELRDQCPVAHSDRYNGMNWITRAADVADAAHNTAVFSSRRVTINEVPTDRPGLPLPPINLDPPDHTERRRLLLPFFSPKATARWEETIRGICRQLLEGLEGRTEIDAAIEYAQEIPGDITARMLGVPTADGPTFRHWLHELLEVGPNNAEVARSTTSAMMQYMLDLIERRRTEPDQGDLVTFMLSQEIDGSQLSDDEIARTLFLLLIAGIDTTWSAIGFSLLHLSQNPQDRQRIIDDPAVMPSAVEEFLRAYSPVLVARLAEEDSEIAGCPIRKGEWTTLSFPSANRDPELFDDPDTVILDREANRHSAFGLGVHRCLGSNLARLEMQIAIEMWMERFPDFTLIDESVVTYSGGNVRGPRTIPVRIG